MVSPTHSIAPATLATSLPSAPLAPHSQPGPVTLPTELAEKMAHEHAIDFATHSWDLATGGLKTLTAKRELPRLVERRTMETMPETTPPRSYALVLAILACIVLMLIGGGVILFVMLQP